MVFSLLGLLACGGSAPGDAGAGEESASPTPEVSADGDAHSHGEGASHSHEGAASHTHTDADTLASDVVLDPGTGSRWTGSATVLAAGDSLHFLVSVEGAPSGSRHPAELVAGSCQDPGPGLVSLTPVVAGSSGEGSSQTTISSARLDDHGHGAIRLTAPDGSGEACAPVHLASSDHTHG